MKFNKISNMNFNKKIYYKFLMKKVINKTLINFLIKISINIFMFKFLSQLKRSLILKKKNLIFPGFSSN